MAKLQAGLALLRRELADERLRREAHQLMTREARVAAAQAAIFAPLDDKQKESVAKIRSLFVDFQRYLYRQKVA